MGLNSQTTHEMSTQPPPQADQLIMMEETKATSTSTSIDHSEQNEQPKDRGGVMVCKIPESW